MKRLLLFLFVPALVGAFALTSDTTYSSAPKSQPEYLALGDSLGVGFGASDPATKGYVPLFRDFLESQGGLNTDLFLNNLSISGATSSSLISLQLPTAVAELGDRQLRLYPGGVAHGGRPRYHDDRHDLLQLASGRGLPPQLSSAARQHSP